MVRRNGWRRRWPNSVWKRPSGTPGALGKTPLLPRHIERVPDPLSPHSGLLNKQIAANLGTSEKTIKIHRSQVMQKMKADSFADLVRKDEKLQVSSSPSPKS